MGLYNTLTDREKEIYDIGANHSIDALEQAVKIVHMKHSGCESIGIEDFYTVIEALKENY